MTDESMSTTANQPVDASAQTAGLPPLTSNIDQWSAPPPPLEIPPVASVVASQSQTDIPKWFFVLFSLTLAAFFSIATLIALSFFEQSKRSSQTIADQQRASVQIPVASATPVLQLSPTPSETPDSVESLETDINGIDLSDVEEELTNVR